MIQLLSKSSRMQRIKQANQTTLCKVKGSFVSRSFCIRYANIRVQRSQYRCFSTLCHGQKCLKAMVSGAKRKDQGVKRKREEKGKKIRPSWPAQRKVLAKIVLTYAHSNWFTILMQRLIESHHDLGGKKSIWENSMSATDHYVMINWIGHKNIPYIWA